jgi:hypothetical protein
MSDEKGHRFDFDRDKCMRCGMTRGQWEDAGEPRCDGIMRTTDAEDETDAAPRHGVRDG